MEPVICITDRILHEWLPLYKPAQLVLDLSANNNNASKRYSSSFITSATNELNRIVFTFSLQYWVFFVRYHIQAVGW